MDVAFDNITQEVCGIIYPGKLRLRENDFMFKNEKTGKVDHFMRTDIVSAQWISRATGLGLRIKLKNDSSHRYDGFGEVESESVAKFFKKYFDIDVTKRDLCYKGFNWGDVEVDGKLSVYILRNLALGDVLEMSVKNSMAFEIPLSNLSNATLNKNEVIFEFHLNDDAEICLSELRLYTPGTEIERDGQAPRIYEKVTEKADIIQVLCYFWAYCRRSLAIFSLNSSSYSACSPVDVMMSSCIQLFSTYMGNHSTSKFPRVPLRVY